MKRIITCLVAVTAMCAIGAMATAAVSSATVLCKKNVTACPQESIYPSETAVEGKLKSGTAAEFELKALGIPVTVTCTGSTITGKTTGENALPLPATITGLSLSGCGGGCETAESQHLPYTTSIEKTTPGNGSASVASSGSGDPGFKVTNCAGVSKCMYSAKSLTLQISGGNPAVLSANGGTLTKESGSTFGCSTTLTVVSLTYEITSPAPMYVAGGPHADESVLCKEAASVCAAGSKYKSGTTIVASGQPKIELSSSAVECGTSEMSVETLSESGNPLSAGTTLSFPPTCAGTCQSVAAANPWVSSLSATSGGNGTLTVEGQLALYKCLGIGATCYYGGKMDLSVTGGKTSAVLNTNGWWKLERKPGSSFGCPAVAEFSAEYKSSSPAPLYVSKAEG